MSTTFGWSGTTLVSQKVRLVTVVGTTKFMPPPACKYELLSVRRELLSVLPPLNLGMTFAVPLLEVVVPILFLILLLVELNRLVVWVVFGMWVVPTKFKNSVPIR